MAPKYNHVTGQPEITANIARTPINPNSQRRRFGKIAQGKAAVVTKIERDVLDRNAPDLIAAERGFGH